MLEQKISEAKAKLLVDYPYFGMLASRLELARNDDIQAFLSDGERLEYNDEYLGTLETAELQFVLANASMHAALSYERRQKGRMGWLWQLATDYAINALLVENELEMPLHANYDPRFEGMYAEAIYATLKDEIKNEAFDDDESNDTGFNEQNKRHQNQMNNRETSESADGNLPQQEVENVAQGEMMEHLAKEAMAKVAKMGNLPLGLERFFETDIEGKIDWRSLLYNAIDRHYQSDYRMLPPSKKLLYLGTYLPSLYSDMLRLVIAIDSSGSVDEALLGSFIGECESILLSFPNFEIDLLVCDAAVHSHEQFRGGETLRYTLKGGGGTDFRPVFDYIDREIGSCELLLYFTDMQGRFPENSPYFDVLWITPEAAEAPFGEVVPIG